MKAELLKQRSYLEECFEIESLQNIFESKKLNIIMLKGLIELIFVSLGKPCQSK